MIILAKLNSETHEIDLPDKGNVADIKKHFSSLSYDFIKVIFKGKQLNDEQKLADILTNGSKVLLTYSSSSAIQHVQEKDLNYQKATLNYQKALVSRPKHSQIEMGYCKIIDPLPMFADIEKARLLLQKIRDDFGIKQIMKQREWRVGTLKELHPNQQTILGYNQNKGQVIALRLRTDQLDGFRSYESIIKVMLHELAHMVHSAHDQEFHKLNRELNNEWFANRGNRLNSSKYGDADFVESSNIDGQRLGGTSRPLDRNVLYEAAQLRLTKEEQEIEDACHLHRDS